MMDDHTSPTLYERYFLDGQFANWRMSTKYANLNPKTHFLVAMMLLFGSLAIMLALAPLGMCYLAPLASWSSACDFGGGLTVTLGKMRLSQDNCDTVYNKKDWQEAPTISYPGAMKGRRYTVFVLDPDVPDYPNGSYYLHMLQTNVMHMFHQHHQKDQDSTDTCLLSINIADLWTMWFLQMYLQDLNLTWRNGSNLLK
ncbi:uncharacterized protein [Halyomorpha halys]|uniref:uncharacterized protein isoform X2 n=1 Tax=Halyomorpha halys TaxID=286706 RepID=UPI0006D4D7E4